MCPPIIEGSTSYNPGSGPAVTTAYSPGSGSSTTTTEGSASYNPGSGPATTVTSGTSTRSGSSTTSGTSTEDALKEALDKIKKLEAQMQAASSQTGGTGSAAGGAPVSELEAVRKKIKLGQASIQLQLAALMLALAEQSKNSAMQYISAIEATHEESAQVAELLNEARTSQSKAGKDKDATGMSVKMQDYFKKHGLAYDMANNDTYHYKEQWNVAIESLKARQDQLGTDTQQKMVFVQDFMGQYNSYLSGANDSIKQAVQLLRELAKS